MALKALRKESDKDRMVGAKLIASLMASEDMILENISVGLLQARSVLSTYEAPTPTRTPDTTRHDTDTWIPVMSKI
ncbi:hypothetical protein AAZX31_03G121800 [Glycine max]